MSSFVNMQARSCRCWPCRRRWWRWRSRRQPQAVPNALKPEGAGRSRADVSRHRDGRIVLSDRWTDGWHDLLCEDQTWGNVQSSAARRAPPPRAGLRHGCRAIMHLSAISKSHRRGSATSHPTRLSWRCQSKADDHALPNGVVDYAPLPRRLWPGEWRRRAHDGEHACSPISTRAYLGRTCREGTRIVQVQQSGFEPTTRSTRRHNHAVFKAGIAGFYPNAAPISAMVRRPVPCLRKCEESTRANMDFRMVGAIGFEPTTYGTQNRRATRLRHAPTGCFTRPGQSRERAKLSRPPDFFQSRSLVARPERRLLS